MHQPKKLEASSEAENWNSLESSVSLTKGPKESENERGARELTPNKNNSQYHKLFKDLPVEENLLKVYSCALLKEFLIQGRLYISHNWLCFYANLFGKDIKYIFVSLLSRDSVYEVLKTVCSHLQPSSKKSLSVKEYIEETDSIPPTKIVPELKWSKQVLVSVAPSLLDGDYDCRSHIKNSIGLSTKENSFQSEKSLSSETTTTTEVDPEPRCIPEELRPSEYLLLKLFVVLACILVVSSFYLAFRIFHLEQQLMILQRNHVTRSHKK
uniref:GRAM domain-containing protein 2A isoform X2 n=1 Tax=Geotrypetes seraphini TaxID=260995 RepID=A0A6P8NZD2_GEOSA|nr:GRAM domain-containing protein 2A isoform X2 [Geotrypetes seraphini]